MWCSGGLNLRTIVVVCSCAEMKGSNQEDLLELLSDILEETRGFNAHQSGDSAHLVVSTFRDANGVLQNHL